MKKTIYLMRHGQTLFNVRHKIQGWCDAPLTEKGKQQAEIASEYFKDITIESAYSSTQERACDTLEIVTKNMPYERLKGLKEWNFGMFEGESEDLNPPLPYGDFFVKYGGEDEMAVRERMNKTLLNIAENDDASTILCLTHGASLAQFYRVWEDYSDVKKVTRNHNCCIYKYTYENGIFHLDEIFNPDV